jgi:hypothetical protein
MFDDRTGPAKFRRVARFDRRVVRRSPARDRIATNFVLAARTTYDPLVEFPRVQLGS